MRSTLQMVVKQWGPLRMGAQGPYVRTLQLTLRQKGFSEFTGSGYFGQTTDTAVETVQRRAGLPPTGVLDAATAAVIDQMPDSGAPQAPLWLQFSLDHIGLREAPGAKNNPELVALIKDVAPDYQNDDTPWCAGWMSLSLARAGEKPTSRPLWALSYADTEHEPVVRLAGPALGAIAVKKRNGGGHVTMVAGRTRGGALACCGGNQDNMVNVSPYNPAVFLGFYWPKGVALPLSFGMASLPIVDTAGRPVTLEA